MELQWASFKDAAAQCSIARILGGNHAPMDSIPAVGMGVTIGKKSYAQAVKLFQMDSMSQTEVVMSILVLVFMFLGAIIGTSYGVYKLRPQFAATTIDLIRDLRRKIAPNSDIDSSTSHLNEADLHGLSSGQIARPLDYSAPSRVSRSSRQSFQRERQSFSSGQPSIPLDQIELDVSFVSEGQQNGKPNEDVEYL